MTRDEEAARWNAALASGDEEEIERVGDEILRSNIVRIMNDDPNYVIGGWTPPKESPLATVFRAEIPNAVIITPNEEDVA